MQFKRAAIIVSLAGAVVALAPAPASAQSFGASATTTLSVAVAPEAAIQITTANSALAANGSAFNNDFTGSTTFSYKIRTTKTGGTGNIGVEVTTDFSPGGGPSVATPPSTGDALSYTCTVTAPATGCTGSQAASTTAASSVASFGADAHSGRTGNTGSLNWNLTNDPKYGTGTYAATVTFTISAT
jgi:hypothetical protein